MSIQNWWQDPEQLRHFEERLAAIRIGRRDMIRAAAAAGGVAETIEVSPDGSVWTFTIRATKWSNGDPVTAQDFEWSWKRQLDPATKAPYAGFLYDLRNAEAYNKGKADIVKDAVGVKALNDKT